VGEDVIVGPLLGARERCYILGNSYVTAGVRVTLGGE
jgi:hypothetical protein